MWDIKILGFDFYYICSNFFLYCFLGWIYETTYVSIKNKTFINRGFLNGPVIPIYGAGATMIYLFLTPVKDNYVLIFLGGCILATVLEYVTSYVMEKVFDAKWWDYSEYKFNIKGRVCFRASFLWGFLAIAMLKIFQPFTDKIIMSFSRKAGEYITYAMFLAFFCDFIVTVVSTLNLKQKLSDMQKIHQEFTEYLATTKLYENKEEFKNRWASISYVELKENFKVRLEEGLEKIVQKNSIKDESNETIFDKKIISEEIEKRFRNFISKYQKKSESTSIIHSRLIKAFPTLKSVKHEYALKDLREKVNKKRSKK